MRLIITFCSLLLTSQVWANNASAPFIGAWELINVERQTEQYGWQPIVNGNGADTKGIISYSKSGHVQVQIAKQYMPWIILDDDGKAHDMNDATAIGQYRAYFGTFSVYPEKGVVHHEREGFLLPGAYPPLAIRQYTFSGDKLILQVPSSGMRLVWQKYPE